MKLIELEPRWFKSDDDLTLHGLTFLCPHCRATRLSVPFNEKGNAAMHDHQELQLDNPELHIAASPGSRWTKTGETFEDITLTPSVDASASGHWHGSITNGNIQ